MNVSGRMKLTVRTLAMFSLLHLAALSSGCMSLEHLFDSGQKLQMYGGVKSSARYIGDEASPVLGSIWRVLDMPLTAVFDTLILPVSAPVELTR